MIKFRSLIKLFFLLPFLATVTDSFAQKEELWHGKERAIHYKPDGEDFVLVNGSRRFNRALYGSNTGFRAEAGDLPEFALYLPGMGGNLKFGLISGDSSKWIINAKKIETRYRPGSMIYTIEDPLLQNGSLVITALATFEREGLMIKLEAKNVPAGIKLIVAYGGATGIKFSRDGDIGADPESSFYLRPEYCKGNNYTLNKNAFTLYFGSRSLSEEERYEIQYGAKKDSSALPANVKTISGIFPSSSFIRIADAAQQASPLQFISSKESDTKAIAATMEFNGEPLYFFIQNGNARNLSYADLPALFNKAEETRKSLAGRIKVVTPDPFINTIGGALSMAADAVWEDPSFMHGAVAWRMRLNGWRGAYLADDLGWHDRAKKHFSSYALSQVTTPAFGRVVLDTALHLARGLEKMGTSLFSSGYISRNPNGDLRPHHYDMNLVFIDQLLNHFLWTGDTAYVKQMWPLVKRHLEWEKRNFDADGDGLYDAYAAIWASDALQYSGGGVTHSSAYNYKANKLAASLAALIHEDPAPYQKEAAKILKAINQKLWMPDKGSYAEYKDLLGNLMVHPAAALWTIYHAVDSHVPDPFQAFQSLQYIDNNIPHIPVRAKGLADTTLYTLSTTNWQPYTWSLNNVVLGEVMHTALAYWQGGRNEEAYQLWKGSLIESMYLGASPGNFQQISFYDAIRGELYRDFADDIGTTARSLVEGLFGIFPDALHDTLRINPGFPAAWDHASIVTPDIDYAFERNGNTDRYLFKTNLSKSLNLVLQLKARSDEVESVLVNGNPTLWNFVANSIERPVLKIVCSATTTFEIQVKWKGKEIELPLLKQKIYAKGEPLVIQTKQAEFLQLYDPQKALSNFVLGKHELKAVVNADKGEKVFFIKAMQGKAPYWIPISFSAAAPAGIAILKSGGTTSIEVVNNTAGALTGKLYFNHRYQGDVSVRPGQVFSKPVPVTAQLITGTNLVQLQTRKENYSESLIDWDKVNAYRIKYEKVDLSSYFNDEVNNIFKNQYLSPRPAVSTLQLPTQGIGNWAYPLTTAAINDSGLRARAGANNQFRISQGVPFRTPSATGAKNIVFTSQWDNYPDSASISLSGKASHAYFLLAGSTNPMQSRLDNGELTVYYTDGTTAVLKLKNPENWWPIEQDYYEDGWAFTTDAPKPVRVYLKMGEDTRTFNHFTTIKGFSNRGIDGGAGTVLDLPLDPNKTLRKIVLKTIANDVVIGLMSITLVRP
jgi:hypothetical protein